MQISVTVALPAELASTLDAEVWRRHRPKCTRSNVIRGNPAVVVIHDDEEPR
jgi:hypothetical protein